jgi:Type II secretory pathway, component PulD
MYNNAQRQLKRQGNIAKALQNTSEKSSDPLFNKSFSVASIDRFSTIEPRVKEGVFEKEKDDERMSPTGKDTESPAAIAEIKDAVLNKQISSQYELPKELQQKAETALKAVETKQQDEEKIELQFQDADLYTFVKQIEEIFNVVFITDEAIDPLPKGTPDEPTKALKGNKITFKTNKSFSRKQAWDFFITFLDIAGFTVNREPDPIIPTYRIKTNKAAQKSPLPTFIGTDYESLPSNNQLIRFLYFIENSTIDALKNVIPALKSVEGSVIFLQEQKAFLITDKAYNIKSLMEIVKELDKVSMPQAMSVLKLRQTDAEEVKKLYDELTQSKEEQSPFRPFGARKQPTSIYFPENARIIAEPRTNSLILLGPKDAITKIEDFIVKNIDVELDQPYSPLYTYHLQYADAENISKIMNAATRFGSGGANATAAQTGSVRGNDKYMKDMVFTPEPATNKIIIKGDYEDYLIAKKIIAELDQQQPQVALDILILNIDLVDNKELGIQMRSKIPGLDGLLGQNVKFATSGLYAGTAASPIVQNPDGNGATRLLGNLLKLVSSAPAGNTIVTFGQDIFGVWGLLQMLRSITSLQVVSNPFIVTSNKSQAVVSVGETRRVVSGTVIAGSSQTNTNADDTAKLEVKVTPQINQDGMVILRLSVNIEEFTDLTNQTSGNKLTKLIDTEVVVADKEVLALGGLIRNIVNEGMSKTPLFGDIPLLGWFFKNQRKLDTKTSLLILVQSKIIPANEISRVNEFTRDHMDTYRIGMQDLESQSDRKDPIHRMFFTQNNGTDNLGEFLFERHEKNKRRRGRKHKDQDKNQKQDLSILNVTHNKPTPQKSPTITPTQTPTLVAQAAEPAMSKMFPNVSPLPKKRRGASLSSMLASEKTI